MPVNFTVSDILPITAGVFFLFSGGSKLLFSKAFIIHLELLGILPQRLNAIAAFLIIQLECAIGSALILGVYRDEVSYLAIGLVIALSFVTIWGAAGGKIRDCGCYGMVLSVSPIKSVLVNLALIAVLVAGLLANDVLTSSVEMWKVLCVIGIIVVSNMTAKQSLRAPIFDLSLTRTGKKWKPEWLGANNRTVQKSKALILFLDSPCEACKKWIGAIVTNNENPYLVEDVIFVFPVEKREEILQNADIPDVKTAVYIKSRLYRRLAYLTPTAVLVVDGLIEKKWVNQLPARYS